MYLTVNKDKYSGKNNSAFLVKWIFVLQVAKELHEKKEAEFNKLLSTIDNYIRFVNVTSGNFVFKELKVEKKLSEYTEVF